MHTSHASVPIQEPYLYEMPEISLGPVAVKKPTKKSSDGSAGKTSKKGAGKKKSSSKKK